MKNSRIKNGIMRIVQGIIIGAGAILPGISGGVLAVVFGIYRPAMELLTHPRRALQRYWRMLLAVGIGWAIGFLGGGSVILALFHQSETVATCLFIGLILGTLPDLWHEAGTQGRGNGSYISLIVSFLALFGALMAVKFSSFSEMPANFWGFLFCGVDLRSVFNACSCERRVYLAKKLLIRCFVCLLHVPAVAHRADAGQNADDRDDHDKLYQRKACAAAQLVSHLLFHVVSSSIYLISF